MRHRSTEEELAEPQPTMYRRNKGGMFFNALGDNVTGRRLSSFPWDEDESTDEFEWRVGWTRLCQFYVDASMLREEMKALVAERFPNVVLY